MNEQVFIRLLKVLDDPSWQHVMSGGAILMVDDQALESGSFSDAVVIVKNTSTEISDIAILKQLTLENTAKILSNYYFVHPLTQAGFNDKAQRHVEDKGAKSVIANSGQYPAFTLFVDAGEVIAESAQSPRFCYGAFCEIEQPVADSEIDNHVRKWVEHREAYELYLNMNVCRYNC